MARMRIQEYRTLFTECSRPDRRTVIARIKRGELVGWCEGKIWYVDPDLTPVMPSLKDKADTLFQLLTTRRAA